MNKMAVFVEGYSEAIFVSRVVEEIAGSDKVQIDHREIRGGATVPRVIRKIKITKPSSNLKYFVLLFDCGGDSAVKSRILEEHANLTNNGYSKIIGLRDVRPTFTYADIPKLRMGLQQYIKTSLAPVVFVLSVMEVEVWFLAEYTHFQKIDPSIAIETIKASLHFDPINDDLQCRACPSNDLNDCYALAGRSYAKNKVDDTINALDYELIYLEVSNKFYDLKKLVNEIESFLS